MQFSNNEYLNAAIKTLILSGIEITFKCDEEKNIFLDLNSGAKSWLHLFVNDNSFTIKGRYNHEETFKFDDFYSEDEVLHCFLCEIKRCTHGRNYVNQAWLDLLVSKNLVTIKEEIKRTIEF